jgi:HAMP domain-containing protein
MDETQWWIIDIIAPAILLIVLVWLVMKRRSNRSTSETERATHELYREEDKRRREGTDQAEE